MQTQWQTFLLEQGGQMDEHNQVQFADLRKVLSTLPEQTTLASLDYLGIIHATGNDAKDFLQAQLSNDVNLLNEHHAQLSAYCNPKGRMLAQFLIVPFTDGYLLLLPREILDKTLSRLRMFVLRSAVTLEDVTDIYGCMGLLGDDANQALPAQWSASDETFTSSPVENGLLLRLPGPFVRYLLIQQLTTAQASWRQFAETCQPADSTLWHWCDIQAGLPSIWATTAEEFVPQMMNLELIGGVSFKKGCYPGQEIVARMHYLGKAKRRMFRAHSASDDSPSPGTDIYLANGDGQSTGKVVLAQPAKNSGIDLLAVLQLSHINDSDLRLAAPDGPAITLQTLPYSLDPED